MLKTEDVALVSSRIIKDMQELTLEFLQGRVHYRTGSIGIDSFLAPHPHI